MAENGPVESCTLAKEDYSNETIMNDGKERHFFGVKIFILGSFVESTKIVPQTITWNLGCMNR